MNLMNRGERIETLRAIEKILQPDFVLPIEAKAFDESVLSSIMERHGRKSMQIIAILQDLQDEYRYLPQAALRRISQELEIPMTRLYSIATFYKAFRLEPVGRHEICLCMGTACHVRGAVRVKEAISRFIGIEEGRTTSDGRFSFETVRCLGCCGQAPVMTVDGVLHGRVDHLGVEKLLGSYK